MTTAIPLMDLPRFWTTRAKSLRIMDGKQASSDDAVLARAAVYDECAAELMRSLDSAGGLP